ncbi:hypothetical protein [Dongia sedimenti]|uniref:N-acetyltransferase domain-containing protein n=1 Tax=Dongia sedimenti TaxID=3064282 RepID=A0ABU0YGA5_9PROT|nr:hypothetical protein [Rhodospirillaceae bacterium R-7]
MQIEPYQPRHLHELALQPHQQHLGVALREHGWAEQVADAGPCWTALADGEPIACAGFQECWAGRAIAWAILAETAGRHMPALTRAVRRALALHPAERIEAQALVGFAPAARWARLLGFVPETVLRRFHQGRDYQAFVLLKDGADEGAARAPSIMHEPVDRQRGGIGKDDVEQHEEPKERTTEIQGGEQVDGDRRHRNQNQHPIAARYEKADHEAGGEGQDVTHPYDLDTNSTPTGRPPLLEPNAGADKISMPMLKGGFA